MADDRWPHKDRVVADPRILAGKLTIKGTRISVELVLKRLSQSLDLQELLEAYPRLTLEDVKACVAYAYLQVRDEETEPPFYEDWELLEPSEPSPSSR